MDSRKFALSSPLFARISAVSGALGSRFTSHIETGLCPFRVHSGADICPRSVELPLNCLAVRHEAGQTIRRDCYSNSATLPTRIGRATVQARSQNGPIKSAVSGSRRRRGNSIDMRGSWRADGWLRASQGRPSHVRRLRKRYGSSFPHVAGESAERVQVHLQEGLSLAVKNTGPPVINLRQLHSWRTLVPFRPILLRHVRVLV